MMHIALLSFNYPPEIGANSRLVEGLSQELSRLGEKVTILTDIPHYPDGIVPSEYRGKLFMSEEINGIKIIRNWLVIASKNNFWLRIANNLSFSLSSIIGGLFCGKQDIIYVYSPPLFLGFSAYILSKIKQIPFIINVQDIYPEIAVQYGMIRNPKIINLLERFEKWVYHKASHISVISPGFKQNIINKFIEPNKITVIPNWVETDFFVPRPKDNPFSREFGLNKKFVAMYAGNIGHSQGLETVIEAARLLADRNEILFVILGAGAKKQELERLATTYNLANVLFLPLQPRHRMPDILASADVSFVILEPEKSKTTIQSKTYEIMAMERPIIASVDANGDNWAIVHEGNAGIWVEPRCPEELAKGVLQLYENISLRTQLGKNGRRYVLANNSNVAIAKQYQDLFSALLQDQIAHNS